MMRKFVTLLAAFAFAATTLSPVAADARDRRGGGYYDGRHHGHHGRHYRDRDDGDAVAAGVVGLVLGLAIGSLASQPREPRYACRDNYQRCGPPPRYEDQRYYDDSRLEGGYDPRYDDRAAYQGDDYYDPYQQEQRMCSERQWDRYANRYVTVDVPC